MKTVTAKQWGMPPLGDHSTRTLSVVREANVHHSDSPRAKTHAGCTAQVRGFDTYPTYSFQVVAVAGSGVETGSGWAT